MLFKIKRRIKLVIAYENNQHLKIIIYSFSDKRGKIFIFSKAPIFSNFYLNRAPLLKITEKREKFA